MVVVPAERGLQRVVQVDERQVVAHGHRAAHSFEAHELGREHVGLMRHLAPLARVDSATVRGSADRRHL